MNESYILTSQGNHLTVKLFKKGETLTFLFFTVFFFYTVFNARGQSAKSYYESGAYYESQGQLPEAMDQFYFAADKNGHYFSNGYESFERVARKHYNTLYKNLDNAKSKSELPDSLRSLRTYIRQWQSWWNNQKEYTKAGPNVKIEDILPEFETYYRQYSKAQSYYLELIQNSSSYEILTSNIQDFINFRNEERDLWSPVTYTKTQNGENKVEIKSLLGFNDSQRKTVDQKMYSLGCPFANKEYSNATSSAGTKQYRQALKSINQAIDISQKCKCNDPRLESFKEKIMNEGRKDILIMPLRGQDLNGIFSEGFSDIVAEKIQSKKDEFVHAMGKTDYENVLFKNDMDINQYINLTPVELGKLAKVLGIEYVFVPTITLYNNGNEALQRNAATAYLIQSTYDGKYYAEMPVTYYKVNGRRISQYKIEIKLYSTLPADKGIVFKDVLEYTEDMELNFYEGCDPSNCNSYKVNCCYSTSRPNDWRWKEKFRADKMFPPIQNTLDNAKKRFAVSMSSKLIDFMSTK